MKPFSPAYTAAILIVGCILLRVLNSAFPEVVPNVSPLMAVAFVGAMYLPRAWGWLVGPAALVVTEFAFLRVNYLTDASGQFLYFGTFISIAFYFALYGAAGCFGILLSRHRSLPLIAAGSILCSVIFYIASNTFSFMYDLAVQMPNGYPASFAGWVQANTSGLPGYPPAWLFLRNGVLGDLFFGAVLLLALDRALLFGKAPSKAAARVA